MNKILIPMTEYVLKPILYKIQKEIIQCGSEESELENQANKTYAGFLKKPLKLEMFIPCDDDGNMLEPVIQMDYIHQIEGYSPKHPQECYEHDLAIYKKALSKVLFKGVNKDFLGEESGSYNLRVNKVQVAYYKALPDYWV
jgi:hypothetical protein